MITTTHLWTFLVSLLPYILFWRAIIRQRRLENRYSNLRRNHPFDLEVLQRAARKSESAGEMIPGTFAACTIAAIGSFLILNSFFP